MGHSLRYGNNCTISTPLAISFFNSFITWATLGQFDFSSFTLTMM